MKGETQEDTLAGATLHLFLLKNIWRLSNYDSMKILQMASSKRYFFWRTLCFGKYVILVCLRFVRESRIFVETSKSRPTRARLRNRELADEAELVSLSVG